MFSFGLVSNYVVSLSFWSSRLSLGWTWLADFCFPNCKLSSFSVSFVPVSKDYRFFMFLNVLQTVFSQSNRRSGSAFPAVPDSYSQFFFGKAQCFASFFVSTLPMWSEVFVYLAHLPEFSFLMLNLHSFAFHSRLFSGRFFL